ncbi:acyl-CoA dehydrogenase [Apiospora arundinis]|uniref:Acyl-CoA dehydrogenase n=1 Tax=Apiospora arundinis TaxID=335852 RepID=A0ABR2I1R5_9PEZI
MAAPLWSSAASTRSGSYWPWAATDKPHWAWLEQIAYHVKVKPEGWQTKHVAGPVALAKVQGAQVVERAVRESQQIHGGRGYEGGKTMTE